MSVFPEDIYPRLPVPIKIRRKVIKTELDTGIINRRAKWRFPLRTVSLNFENIPPEKADELRLFIDSVGYSYQHFYWFDYISRKWTDQYVGRGDATVTIFNLPGKEIDSTTLTVYNNGTPLVLGTDYTFTAGAGANGEDQITFTLAPADGDLITADFEGRVRLKCILAEDTLEYIHVLDNLRSINITLQEVR